MTKNFIYTATTVKIDSLKRHPFFESIGSFVPTDKFMEDFEYFGYTEVPIVTPDGLILTHTEDVIAAAMMGDEEIDVVVIENAAPEDLTRLIDFRSTAKYGKNRRLMYETIQFLTTFLTKDKDGIKFAKTLTGNKTRDKIAKLLNVSSSSIYNIVTIGNNDPTVLDDIDNGTTTSSKALDDINKAKKDDDNEDEFIDKDTDDSNTDDDANSNTDDTDTEKKDTPHADDSIIEEDTSNVQALPMKKIVTMLIQYDDGSEMAIQENNGSYCLEICDENVPLQYSPKLVKSEKKENNNIAMEHDFMPRHHEKFHIGLVIRSEAA